MIISLEDAKAHLNQTLDIDDDLIEQKIAAAQTSDSSVSNARVLLEYDNTANPTLNTDLTVEVSCNGGTNWTAATLSPVTAYSQGGRRVAETVDQACTPGTSFAARIKTLNNKNVPISVVAMSVH